MTVATDGARMYGSERELARAKYFPADSTRSPPARSSASTCSARPPTTCSSSLGRADRIFNLGYYTWVEQQGVSIEDFQARRDPEFWAQKQTLAAEWDTLIDDFNARTGVLGPEARAYAHLLRAHADAVMVGRKTVEDDNPELTCRLPGLANRSPRRVVLDPKFRISQQLNMFQTAQRVPIIIFGAAGETPPAYPPGVEARQVAVDADGRLDLEAVLQSLAKDGVTRVLVEGGPTISSALLAADLADEIVIARGTEPLGAAGRKPFGEQGLEALDDRARWQLFDQRAIGADTLTLHRRTGRFAEGGGA